MKLCALGAASSTHVVQRAAIMAEFGHEVTLISPTPAGGDLGLNVVACPRAGKGRLTWLWSIARAVWRARADVYHAHYAAELTTWMAWALGKRPLVITVMGGDVLFKEQGGLGPLGRWLTRRALKAAALVTVKSPQLGGVVARFGVARERVMEAVWGVDGRLFKPDAEGAVRCRAAWGVGMDEKVLFSPRMLKPLYNQVLMVEVLAKVHGVMLVLSSYNEDPNYRAQVEAKALELGVASRVLFVPAVPAAEMTACYCAADIVLSLPPSDGTPQSVMEAMACGTPVVMTDLERFKPLFAHRVTCWFSPLNANAVADGVRALLDDAGLYNAIAENAQALVGEKADFETQARAVEARLLALAERH